MVGKARTTGSRLRGAARLFMCPNELRRLTDRVETAVVVLLSALFLAAAAVAPYLGMYIYGRSVRTLLTFNRRWRCCPSVGRLVAKPDTG